MLGAIAGDIIGSVFEFDNIKSMDFDLFSAWSHFTDDTVLTVAVADCILHSRDYSQTIRDYALRYPDAGYGSRFWRWVESDSAKPYNSLGNGSAMRVSPVGFAYDSLEMVMEQARRSAVVTHNHPEGIKGAQAVASAIFWARTGRDKTYIREQIETLFGYDLSRSLDEIRPDYAFDETCPGSVPQAITAFLESDDYEDAIRKAISIGGDSDTIACIAGGIAQAYYKFIPKYIITEVRARLYPELLAILDEFAAKYGI
jgi:ADP-ribosylglycohydrolase